MTSTYIIDCVDTTDSWNNYQNVDKFFVAVNRVPLLVTLSTAIVELDLCSDIYVSSIATKPLSVAGSTPLLIDDSTEYGSFSSWLKSYEKWNKKGPTIFLTGGTYYTSLSMDTICTNVVEELIVYGRKFGSKFGISDRSEIYGLAFPPERHADVKDAMTKVIAQCSNGDRNLLTLNDILEYLEPYKWANLDDATQEIKTPTEYHTLMNTLELVKL